MHGFFMMPSSSSNTLPAGCFDHFSAIGTLFWVRRVVSSSFDQFLPLDVPTASALLATIDTAFSPSPAPSGESSLSQPARRFPWSVSTCFSVRQFFPSGSLVRFTVTVSFPGPFVFCARVVLWSLRVVYRTRLRDLCMGASSMDGTPYPQKEHVVYAPFG